MRVLIAALLAVLVWPALAIACRCNEPTMSQAYARADAVAMVSIEAISQLPGDITCAKGVVTQSWKSTLPESLTIFTGEDCSYRLNKGGTYLLYLKRNKDGEFGTYRCRGNKSEAESAAPVRWLNRHGKRTNHRTK